MAEPGKGQPQGLDKAKLRQILVPAAAVAGVVVLVAVVAMVSGAGGRQMSDGSDGSADDPGLKEITRGVKYRDLKEGSGDPCPPGAKVTIHYTGWLTDGTVFDSSKTTGSPATFPLANLIAGWQEGIPGMKPGGIRKLVIAPDKGYGSQKKDKIPPGSTLIFEVELISFEKPAPPKNVTTGPGKPMSDGSNGGTEDPGLKDIGEGLKVRDLKEGSGEPVKEGAAVTMHYTGWTVDGTVFDSSRRRGDPFEAILTPGTRKSVIRGWEKGIPGMKPGGIRKLVIPADLAYGARGSPPDIPPGATLIFEVELVK